jgi:hypothetical protein
VLQNCGLPGAQQPVFVKILKSYILHARKIRFWNLVHGGIQLKEAYVCCEHMKFFFDSDKCYKRERPV